MQLSFLRALAPSTPTWVFPAMNTLMYMHPLTAQHLASLEALGYEVHGPIAKRLACGDLGTLLLLTQGWAPCSSGPTLCGWSWSATA